jgi:hypothetical protein
VSPPVGLRETVRRRGRVAAVVWMAAVVALAAAADVTAAADAEPRLTTWDGRHGIDVIDATLVYFVPADRTPLADWAERVGWFAERIARFHAREFSGQSRVRATIHPRPVVSALPTRLVRAGDANAFFDRTLREVEAAVGFGAADATAGGGFPVLVVLSDVNWRPLDDFSRQAPGRDGWRFDGSLSDDGSHVPGAKAGGSRAVYRSDAGKGWGLVSADGWRVPMRGSDCVVYHEGIGHAIGLPHPDPLDGSVMGLGQYRGWLGESWVDESQKRRLGWQPRGRPAERGRDLLGGFRALPRPATPRPGEPVSLSLEWPAGSTPTAGRIDLQTSLRGPWVTLPLTGSDLEQGQVPIGSFDRAGGVAYRVRVATAAADPAEAAAEVWGYFQVRAEPHVPPVPVDPDPADRAPAEIAADTAAEVELLPLVEPERAVLGTWQTEPAADGGAPTLVSPRAFGARIEIPHAPPPAYRLTVVATPLDEPHGLVLGQRSPAGRFVVLLDFRLGDTRASALENVDGRNVQSNTTRIDGPVFRRGRPALVVCTVRADGVEVQVDGRTLIDWRGDPARLSLADYWATPDAGRLFLGTYDCRYRFHRVTLESLAARADTEVP